MWKVGFKNKITNTMKKNILKKHIIFSILSAIIPVSVVFIVRLICIRAFGYNRTMDENAGINIAYFVYLIGGISGLFFSVLGIYYSFYKAKILPAIILTLFFNFPAMVVSAVFTYSFFILNGIF